MGKVREETEPKNVTFAGLYNFDAVAYESVLVGLFDIYRCKVIPTPSHLLDRISPIFPRSFPFFARFHRLDGTVATSPKPERRHKLNNEI